MSAEAVPTTERNPGLGVVTGTVGRLAKLGLVGVVGLFTMV